MLLARLKASPALVPAGLTLTRTWDGPLCRATLHNPTDTPIVVPEIVLFELAHGLPGTTPLYAEAFQMLSQLAGTLESPTDLGLYPDRTHYRIPEPEGLRTGYGVLALRIESGSVLLGFTSCRRFIGRLSFDGVRLRISLDTENRVLAPGAHWELEEFLALTGPERAPLFDQLAQHIAVHHPPILPPILPPSVPTGWCSWYCFGPDVTAQNLSDNLGWIKIQLPELRYIQLDDGYQPTMGDWLDTGPAFGGSVQRVLKEIASQGFEPALWVAPFIASESSQLFQQHPDWFVQDASGAPLRSDTVGFGGWRLGPWYCLDGTHPAVQDHFEALFRTLNRQWGVTYFKLDANYWGAIHGGHHFDKNATRIEAYRRGMEAILRGAGENSILLGCNHPIWPSLGLIHASRSSNDIERSWESFTTTGRENLARGWQNGRLWWNDPDCLLLTGDLPENEFVFHATLLYATGGMLLSGDDLTTLPPERRTILKKLLPPTGVCARFTDEHFTVGEIRLSDTTRWVLFNADDLPAERTIPLTKPTPLTDVWTGEALGRHHASFTIVLPARSARLIETQA